MTPATLLTDLEELPAEAPLIFETPAGEIGPGYHVTELKRADVLSIDCGANVAEWTETALQLLDGKRGSHMSVGRLVKILAQSTAKVERLADSPVHVEFGHGNIGLRLYEMAAPELVEDAVRVRLSERSATCKPALTLLPGSSDCACYTAKSPEGCC